MKSLVSKYPIISFILFAVLPVYLILVPLKLIGVANESLKPLKFLLAFTPLLSLYLVHLLSDEMDAFACLFQKLKLKIKPIGLYISCLLIFIAVAFLALFIRYL